jgi:hypothetical protein
MASVQIPGTANVIEARQQLMNQAIAEQFNIVTATPAGNPDTVLRPPSASNLGRPLTTARLG